MTRRNRILPALTLAALAVAGCGGQRREPVTVKGSDTMVILGQRWAEAFMGSHPGAVVQVTGGGSGTGIAALINGTTLICESSRPMKDEEKQQIQAKYGKPVVEIPVARDGLTVYLNEANPIKELSLDQIKGIYTGQVTDWKQVGGPSGHIVLYGRENSSGTYEFFKEHVLQKADFAASVQTLPGTSAVVNAVARDPNGIGYGGAAYAKGVRAVAVKKDEASPGVLPTQATVLDGSYPISRLLYIYLRSEPQGTAKEFVDFVLSPQGQSLATEVGYFPIKA